MLDFLTAWLFPTQTNLVSSATGLQLLWGGNYKQLLMTKSNRSGGDPRIGIEGEGERKMFVRPNLQLLSDFSAKVVGRKGTRALEGDGRDVTAENFVQKIPKELEMAEIKLDPMEMQVLNVVSALPLVKVLREPDSL